MQETNETHQPKKQRTIRQYIAVILSGFAMGVCEIIPGVSGGTMAFILGIYEELIKSIEEVTEPDFIKAVTSFNFKRVFQLLNWQFLVALAVGMLIAILTLSNLVGWMLDHYPALIWSFFFGLVLASIWIVRKRVKNWTAPKIALSVAVAIFSFWLVGLVPGQTSNNPIVLILSGAIAICAFILPGVSGSFILAVLGKYKYVLDAVSGFVRDRDLADFMTIFWVALGCAIGIITFARVVSYLFKNYHDTTIAVLLGFMTGSLRVIWPWKSDLNFIDAHEAPTNVMPVIDGQFFLALVCFVVGIVAIFLIDRASNISDDAHLSA